MTAFREVFLYKYDSLLHFLRILFYNGIGSIPEKWGANPTTLLTRMVNVYEC